MHAGLLTALVLVLNRTVERWPTPNGDILRAGLQWDCTVVALQCLNCIVEVFVLVESAKETFAGLLGLELLMHFLPDGCVSLHGQVCSHSVNILSSSKDHGAPLIHRDAEFWAATALQMLFQSQSLRGMLVDRGCLHAVITCAQRFQVVICCLIVVPPSHASGQCAHVQGLSADCRAGPDFNGGARGD